MTFPLSFVLSVIGTLAGSFFIGLSLPLPNPELLLTWANTGIRVLYVLVLVVGVVVIGTRFVGADQGVSSESAAKLRVIAGIVVLWLLGCGAGIAFQLLR